MARSAQESAEALHFRVGRGGRCVGRPSGIFRAAKRAAVTRVGAVVSRNIRSNCRGVWQDPMRSDDSIFPGTTESANLRICAKEIRPSRNALRQSVFSTSRRASMTASWSRSWESPDTAIVPITPVLRMMIGNAPPNGIYSRGSRNDSVSIVFPMLW